MSMDRLIVSEPGAAKRMGLRPHVVGNLIESGYVANSAMFNRRIA